MIPFRACLAAALCLPAAVLAQHDAHLHEMHMQHQAAASAAATPAAPAKPAPLLKDGRQAVRFPRQLRLHTLANMRDHLLALQEIQRFLAQQEYEQAADVAEQRLGMSSLALHGAHEVARYMPPGMRETGTDMHRHASRFAVAARDAGATGDIRPALEALSRVTGQCVACHAGYRVK